MTIRRQTPAAGLTDGEAAPPPAGGMPPRGRLQRLRATARTFFLPALDSQALVAASPAVPVREIFRRFWPYARPYRRWIVVGLLLIAAVPALDTAMIWMFKLVVDEVLVPQTFGPLLWIALAYLGLTILDGVFSFFDEYVSTWIGERFLLSLRTDFFRHLQGLSLAFFERRRLGDVLSRLTGDVAAIEGFVLGGVTDAISYVLQIVFFAGALFYLRWDLALVSLVVTPLFWLIARHFSRLIKVASREKRRRSGSISSVAEESLSQHRARPGLQPPGLGDRPALRAGRRQLPGRDGVDSHQGALLATRRPGAAARGPPRPGHGDVGALARCPNPGRAARLHHLSHAALHADPEPRQAGEPDPLGVGGRGADHRVPGRDAGGDRARGAALTARPARARSPSRT